VPDYNECRGPVEDQPPWCARVPRGDDDPSEREKMSNLKKELIRLGSDNPELRQHLRPILDRIASYDSFSKLKEFIEKDLNSPTLAKLLENYAVGDTPLQSDINYADPDIASLDRYIFEDTLTGPVAQYAEAFLEWLEDFRY